MIYAIGDIHGQIEALRAALALIRADGGDDAPIVFLGDYPDRGPDTRRVIDLLIDGIERGRPWVVLRGNHDRMFSRFVRSGNQHDGRILSGKGWLHADLGGPATLASYGVDAHAPDVLARARASVPETHLDFIESRPLWHRHENLLFVHAGLRPGVAPADQEEDDLIWIRDGWLDDPRDHGALVVHGHTALHAPRHHGNRLNLDGGAGYGRPLVPALIEGSKVWLLSETGRHRLRPTPDY